MSKYRVTINEKHTVVVDAAAPALARVNGEIKFQSSRDNDGGDFQATRVDPVVARPDPDVGLVASRR
jgi:hypothetical protein